MQEEEVDDDEEEEAPAAAAAAAAEEEEEEAEEAENAEEAEKAEEAEEEKEVNGGWEGVGERRQACVHACVHKNVNACIQVSSSPIPDEFQNSQNLRAILNGPARSHTKCQPAT